MKLLGNYRKWVLRKMKAAEIERMGAVEPEWTKDDYLLYYAYVVYKMNDWKYKAAAQLSRDGHTDLALKHPCDIDGDGAIRDAIKMVKPELADLPFDERLEAVEKYLFG